MRARQRDRGGERSLFRCQRATDGLVGLANLLYVKNNLGDGDNSTHTQKHTHIDCDGGMQTIPPTWVWLASDNHFAIPLPALSPAIRAH